MKITVAPTFSSDPSIEFRSYTDLLRWLAANVSQYGQRQSVQTFYLGSRTYGPPETREIDPHGAFRLNQKLWKVQLTQEQYEQLFVLQERYVSFHRHLTEVAPEWKTVDRINWADNSVDLIQEAKDGRRRTVQETAPHGDICY